MSLQMERVADCDPPPVKKQKIQENGTGNGFNGSSETINGDTNDTNRISVADGEDTLKQRNEYVA